MAKKTVKEVNKAMAMPVYKPTITLDKSIYPDIKNLKIDQVVELKLKVKINNISRSQYDPQKPLHVTGTIENAAKEKGGIDDDGDY